MVEGYRTIRELVDSRTSFQRLHDSRIMRGWIVAVEGNYLAVRAGDDPPLAVGERFASRTSRFDCDVAFLAVLQDASSACAEEALRRAAESDRPTMLDYGDRMYVFEVLGQPVTMPATDDPRYACEPSRVIVGHAEAELRDVSPSGLGVVSLRRYYPGEPVSVEIEVGGRMVEIEAEVKNCRQLAIEPPMYRLGLRVVSQDRIRRAQWLSVVKDRSLPRTRSWALDEPGGDVEPVPLPRPEETGIAWAYTTPSEPQPETPPSADLWEGRQPLI